MTRMTPLRFTTLQCSHSFFTDALTFILKLFLPFHLIAVNGAKNGAVKLSDPTRLAITFSNNFGATKAAFLFAATAPASSTLPMLTFEWDAHKAGSNLAKPGVSFEEAATHSARWRASSAAKKPWRNNFNREIREPRERILTPRRKTAKFDTNFTDCREFLQNQMAGRLRLR